MSQELYVFLNKSEMLTPHDWQQHITRNGFETSIDTDFDPFSFTGFLPCHMDGRTTGFEYYFSPKADVAPPETYLAKPTEAFDSVVSFIWRGDLRELMAVLAAATSLANACPSLLHDPYDDSSVNGTDALAYARQQIAIVKRSQTPQAKDT